MIEDRVQVVQISKEAWGTVKPGQPRSPCRPQTAGARQARAPPQLISYASDTTRGQEGNRSPLAA